MFSLTDHQRDFYERLGQWYDAGHKLKFTLATRTGRPYWWCTQCDQSVAQTDVIEKCKNNAIHIRRD